MSKEIFISHSHKDKLFIDFVNQFLKAKVLSHCFNPDEISFTSDNDKLMGKISGDNNLELLKEASKSKLFICCISEHYNSSPFCILEHGVAYNEFNINSSNIEILPILADGFNHKDTLITINSIHHASLSEKDSLKEIFLKLQRIFPTKKLITQAKYDYELEKWYKGYDLLKRKYNNLKSNKDDLYRKIISAFPKDSDIEAPITVFCNRGEYEGLSMEASNKADHILIWTLYKSPLLVKEAYMLNKYLTKYDIFFKKSKAAGRYRLVIFDDYSMAKQYMECDASTESAINAELNSAFTLSQIQDRKKAFEKANCGLLYFTTRGKIEEWYRSFFGKSMPVFFDYEFGFIANSTALNSYFGFTSGFHSNTGVNNCNLKKHMIFYPKAVHSDLAKEFEKRANGDYCLFYDIPIQIKLVEHLLDPHSELRNNYVISGSIQASNIDKLL